MNLPSLKAHYQTTQSFQWSQKRLQTIVLYICSSTPQDLWIYFKVKNWWSTPLPSSQILIYIITADGDPWSVSILHQTHDMLLLRFHFPLSLLHHAWNVISSIKATRCLDPHCQRGHMWLNIMKWVIVHSWCQTCSTQKTDKARKYRFLFRYLSVCHFLSMEPLKDISCYLFCTA